MRMRFLYCLGALLAPVCPASVLAQPVAASASEQEAEWSVRAGKLAGFLDAQWGKSGGWDGIGGWQRFVAVDALIAYQQRTGDTRWRDKVDAAVRDRSNLPLNDDALWAVIASVHAWQRDGDPDLLNYAAATFAMVAASWDNRCAGGVWWDPAKTYKNAITNELLIYAATQLAVATGDATYRDWALTGWAWFQRSTMIDGEGLVNDGLAIDPATGLCRNNGQPRWTYNQGVLIGGLDELTRLTGDPQYRARAVRLALSAIGTLSGPDGVLREPVAGIGTDGLSFKGVFALHLGHLLDAMPDGPERRQLLAWTRVNAEAVWRSSGEGTMPVDSDWTGATAQYGSPAQVAGLSMLVAAIR